MPTIPTPQCVGQENGPMARISVVLATYNGEAFLQEQLDSLAKQTLLPFELVISDDGSTDNTLNIARSFVAPFPVHIFSNRERLGYGDNFLRAAVKSVGDFIAFCDQDDIWYPNKLEICAELINSSGAIACVHSADLIDANGEKTGSFTQRIRTTRTIPHLTSKPWMTYFGFTIVFSRELLLEFGIDERGPDFNDVTKKLAHDQWIYFLASSVGEIVTTEIPLAAYRLHQSNTTAHKNEGYIRWMLNRLSKANYLETRRDRICMHRSAIMGKVVSQTANTKLRTRAFAAQKYWQQLSQKENYRLSLYDANSSFLSRVVVLTSLIYKGYYGKNHHGGMGFGLLFKDIVRGVF